MAPNSAPFRTFSPYPHKAHNTAKAPQSSPQNYQNPPSGKDEKYNDKQSAPVFARKNHAPLVQPADKTVRASTTPTAEAAPAPASSQQQVPPSQLAPHFSQSPSQNATNNNHPGADNNKIPPSQASHPPNSAQTDAATFLAINPQLLPENREQTLKLLLLHNKKKRPLSLSISKETAAAINFPVTFTFTSLRLH